CGIEMPPHEIAQLADEGVIAAVKASQGDPYRGNELRHLCKDKLRLFYGHDYAPLEALLAGAAGWVTRVFNAFPRLAKDLFTAAALEKNVERSRQLWARLAPYIHFAFDKAEGTPHLITIYKEALHILGRPVGRPRLPLQTMSPEKRKRLEAVI